MKKCPINVDTLTGLELLAVRKSGRKTQSEFWGKLGVTQSGASRYESGRNVPKPLRIAAGFTYSAEILRHRNGQPGTTVGGAA